MSGDKQVRARVSDQVAAKIDSIVDDIMLEVPESNVTVSSILRFAIEEYVRRYDARKSQDTLFLEIPIRDLRYEEMDKVFNALNTLSEVIENNSIETVDSKEKRDFVRTCDKATDLLLYKMGGLELSNTAKKNQEDFDKLHGRDQEKKE